MKKILLSTTAIVTLLASSNALAGKHESSSDGDLGKNFSEFVNSMPEAIKNGKAYIDVRYRYEYVDQVGGSILNEAKASTIRTKLGFKSGEFFGGMQGHLEFENITVAADKAYYNNTMNGRTAFPTVADPDGNELNQAYLQFNYLPQTVVKLGRQIMNLDNQRFIGSVGWRQNDQTMDAVSVENTTVDNLKVHYSHITNVNRIFGNESPAGEWDSNIHTANVNYKVADELEVTAYGYFLDINDSLLNSSQTIGAFAKGTIDADKNIKVKYRAEYATQEDYGDNTTSYDAGYYNLKLGVNVFGIDVFGGYEVLESDNGTIAFRTPLATGHKFNGWSDRFLTTPASGLEDTSAGVGYKVKDVHEYVDGLVMKAIYHEFTPDQSGVADYGNEVNLLAKKNFGDHYSFLVKYADFEADSANTISLTDTEKFWFQLGAKF
jgi:hypothetical protein